MVPPSNLPEESAAVVLEFFFHFVMDFGDIIDCFYGPWVFTQELNLTVWTTVNNSHKNIGGYREYR
jgi:hypothetical protein